jgi:hypothetical protein
MSGKKIKLSDLKLNEDNPRYIKDTRFDQLVKSLTEFPKMLSLRPIVIDEDGTVLAGNMRLRALTKIGYEEVPEEWVRKAADLTPEEQDRFVIMDNENFGSWDWDVLNNEWNVDALMDWGLEVPVWQMEGDYFEVPDSASEEEEEEPDPTPAAGISHNDYSQFTIVMLHDNKLKLLQLLNNIQDELDLDKQEDALMAIIEKYQSA